MKKKSLAELNINETAQISSLAGGKIAIKRLVDLGLTPGTEVKIIRKAMGAGPLQIEVHKTKLIIGRKLAANIEMQNIR